MTEHQKQIEELLAIVARQSEYIEKQEHEMSIVAQALTDQKTKLNAANAALTTEQAALTAAQAIALDQSDAAAVIAWANAQTPPVVVSDAITTLAGQTPAPVATPTA